MADEASQSKNEPASVRRREKARERGEVPFSAELASSTSLLASLSVLIATGPWVWSRLADLLRMQLSHLTTTDPTMASTKVLFGTLGQFVLTTIGPLMGGALVLSVVTGLWQTGHNVAWQPLSPKLERLMPGRGISRIFSMKTIARLIVIFVKVSLLTGVVAGLVGSHFREWFSTPVIEFEPLLGGMGAVVAHLCLIFIGCFLVIGIADYAFQRWKYEQDLMMSRQELKEERKEEEGDSNVRSTRRRRQRELLRQQIERDVPKATVIVTNSTHFAVALRYERGKMSAPQVVAKGQDLVARRIIAIASRQSIPVVRKPELARTLYKTVKVGKNVPSHLFRAVAEIIAHIYRAKSQVNVRSSVERSYK
ncbi:MAG: EscU/YscU/HrcU family type III secretion system export apparatus switch protein [Planctomycetota bacterium]|nr:EscU/YscU/HrcU family type III secretion system export apparatus switch protein [Planctomycetota bacterium]MDA1178624.1 EscU/YscU/HrcU family type III secretion system export apparatus switch protein [Planctomycetota bacterium]